jgi:HPr Serine kinase C-terminal domain
MTTRTLELLGVTVKTATDRPTIADPVVDGLFLGGRVKLTAVRDRALVQIEDVAVFCVEHGSSVTVATHPGADPDLVSRWLGGTVLTLLLGQRCMFALHASVVEIDGVAVAICGVSGAGKSTTALRLAQRGHSLVTDELSVLTPRDRVTIQPVGHPLRVLPETAFRLGLDTSEASRVPRQRKLVLPAELGAPLELAAIVELERGGNGGPASAEIRGPRAHWAVGRHTHRHNLLRPLFAPEIFRWANDVAAAVPMHRITRPAIGWTVDAVADLMEETALRVR